MASIDPRGPGPERATRSRRERSTTAGPRPGRSLTRGHEATTEPPRESAGPESATRQALSRSTLWGDDERGAGSTPTPQPLRARWDPVPPPRTSVTHRRRRSQRRRSAVGWFVHHYGWRAYALPVLAALTVMTVIGLVNSSGSTAGADGDPVGDPATVTIGQSVTATVTVSGGEVTKTVLRPGAAAGSGSAPEGARDPASIALTDATVAKEVPPTPDIDPADAFKGVVMGVLPPGAPFAKTGAGTFHVVPGSSDRIGTGGDVHTFTIEVEDGIESAAADRNFAHAVMEVLSSRTSWIGSGDVTLQRIDSGQPDFRVTLVSQMTTRQPGYCGWGVQLEASCYNQAVGRVVINDARWMRGAYAYDGDLASYRVYAINHEVGHALGQHHLPCPVSSGVAPVMMQQSWSTSDDDIALLNSGTRVPADGKVCRANPFPFPPDG